MASAAAAAEAARQEAATAQAQAQQAINQASELDRAVFGNRNRPGDEGAMGEVRREIRAIRDDFRKAFAQMTDDRKAASLWLKGLIGSIIVVLLGAVITLIVALSGAQGSVVHIK